jgi:uncharacterized membrane protein YjfL (UPF0719 family)
MVDIASVLLSSVLALEWIFIGVVGLGIGLPIALKIFDAMTKDLDEMKELKNGNIAVGIVIGSLFISVGIVVGFAIQ